jgi:hypothetical protein
VKNEANSIAHGLAKDQVWIKKILIVSRVLVALIFLIINEFIINFFLKKKKKTKKERDN